MADKYTNDPSRKGAVGGAQIYHERKGLPVWLWPLLALLVLGLLFALLHHGPRSTQARTTPVPSSAPAPSAAPATDTTPASASGTPIVAASTGDAAGENIKVHSGTDIATAKPAQATAAGVPLSNVVFFAAATDPASFIGHRAKLTDVTVQKVISDRAFFVGPSPQQQVLVLMD